MTRYVALLRGVSPMNCRMAELRACMEQAGFTDVRTILSSGNVAFTARTTGWPTLERKIEAAMLASLGRSFDTIIRSQAYLQALVASDPFGALPLPRQAKCVVTFLRTAEGVRVTRPVERAGARLYKLVGTEAFSAYEPNPGNPAFMTLLERTFGKEITTRTLATVAKCAVA
jgi:uncharacterized protein (DUF1697 family)